MSRDSPEDEWELSKENVQPLRQGRKLSSLNAGLKPLSGEQLSRIREEKHVFEGEIRLYSGDDPLSVWYTYIQWAEQTFPKGGKDSNLTTILQRCVTQFKDDEKYRNDDRYIYAWIKLAGMFNDPLEIYTFLYDQNIGCELACFYENWASLLEQLGNTKKADAIYLEGLNKHAQPYESLRRKHEEFQKRVARQMAGGNMNGSLQDGDTEDESSRQVLSQLRTSGKRAPVVRTGTSIKGGAGILAGARPKTQPQVRGQVPIFCDENQEPSGLQNKTGSYKTAPKKDIINKENEKVAGVWTKQKMGKSSSVSVPISAVSSHRQPSFSVHVDQDADTSLRTPAKLPEGSHVLSSKKVPKNNTCDVRTIALAPFPQNPGEKPMYCKDKIYTGAEEFSFEEIHAFRWTKMQEKLKREEEERKALEESRKKFEEERQFLEKQTERIRQQRLQLEQEQQLMFDQAREQMQSHFQAHLQDLERQRLSETEKQKEALEREIEARVQEMSVTESRLTDRLQNSLHQLSCTSDPPSQPQSSGQVEPKLTNHSLNTSNRTTPSSFNYSRSHTSAESFDRSMSGAPSPTVNTKEALRLVMGMFNTSLETEKPPPLMEDVPMEEPSAVAPHSVNKTPFAIFDENQTAAPRAGPGLGNRQDQFIAPQPVTTSARRGLCGALQARSGPVEPFRDPEPMEDSSRPASQPLFDDKSEKFESHARDDITLAPVGSHLSFAAAAKLSSTPYNPNMSAGRGGGRLDVSDIEMSERSPGSSKGGMAPFAIFEEKPDPSVQRPKPFAVFEDRENQFIEPQPKAPTSARRGLGSALQSKQSPVDINRNNEPMESSARATSQPLFDDKTEKFESHARDDITLAPVGSHLSFAAAAKLSSTPYNPNMSGGRGGGGGGRLDVSDVEMSEKADEAPASTTGNTDSTQNQSSFSFRKDLSPIMEGSSDESSKGSTLHPDTLAESRPLIVDPMTPIQDRTEDTHSLLAAIAAADDDGMNHSAHLIDMTTYIPPDVDEKTEHLLSMSICAIDPKDPFDSELKENQLNKLKKSLSHYESYSALNECMPDMRKGSLLSLGMEMYTVTCKIAEGGFAKVYLVEQDDVDFDSLTTVLDEDLTMKKEKLAIKVEKPAQKWEFYICTVLHDRLTRLNQHVDVRPSMMMIKNGYFFSNGSCLVMDYMPNGTLLDLANHVKTKFFKPAESIQSQMEPVMVYMTIELLYMVENLHRCHIIHGDIKPDNFLVLQFPRLLESTDPQQVFGGQQRFAQLIDFGQSIDMSLYPSGTTFTSKVKTECFQCIEMMTNQPWTYQTDLFGLAGTIHVLIFSEYMKVYQTSGEWRHSMRILRNWNTNLWKKLFHTLLNVPSCDEIPDLSALRQEFEEYFISSLLPKYNQQYTFINQIINEHKREDFS